VLSNVDELDLLNKLYGTVYTTEEVVNEFGKQLPHWFNVVSAVDKNYQQILEMQVDKGEASAIALALEMKDVTIILDDLKARKVAEFLGIDFTGTLGVIVKAKLKGHIKSVKPIIEKIKNTNFRLSEELEKSILTAAKEN
jgi:predicted nucleic acid-binding protein